MTLQRSQDALRPLVAPANEQPHVSADVAAPLVTRNAKGQPATPADASAMAKRPRRRRYLPRNITCAEDFAPHNRRRVDWTRRRMKELTDLTGEVSHGVGAMVACAGWLYAGGEWAMERAAAAGDVELFKQAASLTATARTHDMGAWEIATREAEARKAAATRRGNQPWFQNKAGSR